MFSAPINRLLSIKVCLLLCLERVKCAGFDLLLSRGSVRSVTSSELDLHLGELKPLSLIK